jgi:outer membrane biosynthesis protein TonB
MRRLRLSRTTADAATPIQVAGAPAIAAATALQEHIARSVPQLAGFLADPAIAEDRTTIDWYATISGTAIPLQSLQGGDRTAAEERLQLRLGQLRSLAAATTDPRLKALLEAAANYPGPDSVFVVGQEPVLTQWGNRAVRAAATVPPVAQAATPVGAAAPGSRSWLLPAMLAFVLVVLLLLGSLAWMQRDKLVAWLAPPEATALDPAISMGLDLVAQLDAERQRATTLREQVKALRKEFEDKKLACAVPPPPEPTPPPEPAPPPEKKVESPPPPPKPEKKVEVPPKKVEPPKPVPPKPEPPKEVATATPPPPPPPPATPKQACEQAIQERKSWDAPEVVFVIDASGSMREAVGGETRLAAAKQSVTVIADNLPADVDTALVKFNGCNSIDNDYFIDRNTLKRKVNSLQAQGGTPLGRSMERAANILSKKKPTVMVVVTDGEDSCGEKDPCAVAAAAKASHPNMTINVVDVSGTGGGACIAQNGGGQVLPARTPAEIKQAMQQATYPTALPTACKGTP